MQLRFSTLVLAFFLVLSTGSDAMATSLEFFVNATGSSNQDHGRLEELPNGFGDGEFTLELWIRPNNSFLPGSVEAGTPGQLTNWADDNNAPYSSANWWEKGNFLIDGINKNASASQGSFALQFYAGGRVRWLFGDGSVTPVGGLWAVGGDSATSPSLLDGQWHQLTLVRRFVGSNARLELWIDGNEIDTEASNVQTNMASTYWDSWTGFDSDRTGWFFGAEKRAAAGDLSQYEDYKGLVDELRFWSRAKSASEISSGYATPVTGSELGLVGWFDFSEGSGNEACDELDNDRCMALENTSSTVWDAAEAPTLVTADTTPPSVPTGLGATPVSSSQINLSWSPSSDDTGVTGYTVRRDGAIVGTPAATSFSDTGLAPNTTYTYTVDAFDAADNTSAESAGVQATTLAGADTTPPSQPANVVATPISETQIDLTWDASTDNVGVVGYRIERDGVLLRTQSTTSYSDTGLTTNTTYEYTIIAFDAAGNSSETVVQATTLDLTPPSVPEDLTADAITSAQIDLDWSASTDNVAVTGYRIRRDGVVIATVPDTSFSNTGLTPETTYSYTVAAVDEAGNESAESDAAEATTPAAPDIDPPSVPTGLSANAISSTEIDLSWSASTDNVGVTGYTVRRNGAVIATISGTSFSDTDLTPETTYSYTVSAFDAAGNNSDQSAAVLETTDMGPDTSAPSVPTGLAGSPESSTRIDLRWSASNDNVGVTGYTVRRNGAVVATVSSTSFIDANLTPDTTYSYTVAAFDAAGNTSAQSAAIQVSTQAVPDTTPPSVPAGLNANAVSGAQIDLSWSASTDNVGVTGYTVRRDGVIVGTTATTTFIDTGLTPNTSYSYTVDAFDAAGNASAESGVVQATTSAIADTTAPSVPSGVAASAVTDRRIDVTWTASSDDVGVSGYTVRRDGQVVVTTSATSFSDLGVSANTTYTYTVAAFDAAGNTSAESSGAQATTPASNDVTPPSVPAGLSASTVSSTEIELTWSPSGDSVGVAGYTVRRDGEVVGTTPGTVYRDTGLAANTTYTYTVDAFDAAGNNSIESASAQATTSDGRAPPPDFRKGGGGASDALLLLLLALLTAARRRSILRR